MLNQTLLDTIENGILVIDQNLIIHHWNKWLVVNTKISRENALNQKLSDLFPEVIQKKLKRKIKIALTLKSSTFMNARIDGYLIKIPLNKMTHSNFIEMQQNVIISPFKEDMVSIVIYDQTLLLEAQYQIEEQSRQFEIQATTDQLTGAYNRLKFAEVLDSEIKRSERYENPLCLILFDIDHFKRVNDTYGHLVGDLVLKTLTNVIQNAIRDTDLFARWGGEEFILLLPETALEGAKITAERIRETISEYPFEIVGHIACSLGLALYHSGEEPDHLVKRADDALYTAKESGRNRVMIATEI